MQIENVEIKLWTKLWKEKSIKFIKKKKIQNYKNIISSYNQEGED